MIYLLHFTVPLRKANGTPVQHYLGYSAEDGVTKRVWAHNHGRSKVAIIRAAREIGSKFILVKTWPRGTRALERYLKNQRGLNLHCPLCREAALKKKATYQRAYRRLTQERLARLSPPPATDNGGSLPARRSATPTSEAGLSPLKLPPDSTTWSGAPIDEPAIGGKSSNVTVPPASRTVPASAGTKQRSTPARNKQPSGERNG